MKLIIVDKQLAESLEGKGLKIEKFSDVNGTPLWKIFCDVSSFNIASWVQQGKCVVPGVEVQYL